MKTFFSAFVSRYIVPFVETRLIQDIEGFEFVPKDINFIVAACHQTSIDHFFVPYPAKNQLSKIHFIGKLDSIFQRLAWGWFYWLAETIAVDRKAKDKRKVLDKAVEALNNGQIIIIYPEGTRNKKKQLLLGKTGVAELSLRSKVPVIPLGLIYRNKKKFGPPVSVRIGKPMYFKGGLDDLNLRKVTDQIMKEIAILSEKKY